MRVWKLHVCLMLQWMSTGVSPLHSDKEYILWNMNTVSFWLDYWFMRSHVIHLIYLTVFCQVASLPCSSCCACKVTLNIIIKINCFQTASKHSKVYTNQIHHFGMYWMPLAKSTGIQELYVHWGAPCGKQYVNIILSMVLMGPQMWQVWSLNNEVAVGFWQTVFNHGRHQIFSMIVTKDTPTLYFVGSNIYTESLCCKISTNFY